MKVSTISRPYPSTERKRKITLFPWELRQGQRQPWDTFDLECSPTCNAGEDDEAEGDIAVRHVGLGVLHRYAGSGITGHFKSFRSDFKNIPYNVFTEE